MSSHRRRWGIAPAAVAALAVVAVVGPAEAQQFDSVVVVDEGAGTVTYAIPDFGPIVIADGLINPRGLAMSPDGTVLVVVESGDAAGQGRLIGIQSNLDVSVLVAGLDFPEGVVFIDDATLIVSSVADQTLSKYVLGDSQVQPIMPLQSAPTGMVTLPVDPAGGFPPVAVSTWNGLGLILENGDVTPFTEPLAGGGHPAFSPDLGVCFPEFDQDWVSCWPVNGGQPQLLQGFDGPVAVAILPSGLVAVSDSTGVHIVDPRDGAVLFTIPFENPGAMVVPGDRERLWLPAMQTVATSTTTSSTIASSTTTAAKGTDTSTATTSTAATGTESTGTAAAPTPSSTAAGQDGGGSSGAWWWLVALIPLILALALLARRRGRPNPGAPSGEPEPKPPTTDVATPSTPETPGPSAASKDPCKELCDASQKAAAEAEKAEAAADAAEKAAADAGQHSTDATRRTADADKKAAAARHEADRADRAVDEAKKPVDHSGGTAESGDRKYTGADNDRVNAASARIDAALAAGDMTQHEAQEAKATLRDPEKWKELREKEEADSHQRIADAERRADQSKKAQRQSEDDARQAHSESDASTSDAEAKHTAAESALKQANEARADAEAKRAACEKCRRDAAIEGAGGPDSWKVLQGGVGGPCADGDSPTTITKTEVFFVADESRSVEVSDESIRPARISSEDRGFIRGVFTKVGSLLGIVSMSPAVPLVFKIPMKYLSFMSKGAAGILDDLDTALEMAKRPGGLSDYYFVKVTVPRKKITVTCTCTIECRDGIRSCVGCAATEVSEPGDLVKTSEGSRAQVEVFIAGMQAQAAEAKEAAARRKAFKEACSCS